MAGKEVKTVIKLQIPAGKANPAPPVGPALGQHGINIMDFCKAYNDATKDKMGEVIPVEITAYVDSSFDFVLKTPPTSSLILKYSGLKKGASLVGREKGRKIKRDHVKEIAEIKMADLSANDIDAAIKIIEGSARSMGIEVV